MSNFPPPQQLIGYLGQAQDIAQAGGEISRGYFGTSIEIELKSDKSPVTRADRESEIEMRSLITSANPDHRILGEEYGESGPEESKWQWILDPIDGTKSFIHGIPLYTVLVALLYEDEPLIGVIYNPQSGELLSAGLGMGCWLNGKQVQVSNREHLEESRLQVTDPGDLLRSYPKAGTELMKSALMTRTWADAYGYFLVATGRAELMVDPELSLWDAAPLPPIIREAGGVYTDLAGNHELGTSALASNGLVHAQALASFGIDHFHAH